MDSHDPGTPPATQEAAGPHGQIERSLAVMEVLTLHAAGLGRRPFVQEAKNPIAAGRLGRIVPVHASCWFYRPTIPTFGTTRPSRAGGSRASASPYRSHPGRQA